MSDSRKSFEAWFMEFYEEKEKPDIYDDGDYVDTHTHSQWIAWQHQQARIDALESKIEELEGDLRTRCNE